MYLLISKLGRTRSLSRTSYTSALNHEQFMNGTSATYIADMYNIWKSDPTKVHSSWDAYFKGVDSGRPVGQAYVSPPSLATSVSHRDLGKGTQAASSTKVSASHS